MYESNVIITTGAQGAKTAGLGASSQQAKQSPTVEACKNTFKTAMQAAQDKNADTAALNNQKVDSKAAETPEMTSVMPTISPVEELSTTPDVVPAPDDVDESQDFLAISDALTQLLMAALTPTVSDEIVPEDTMAAINQCVNELPPEKQQALLKLLEGIISKLAEAIPEDSGGKPAGFADLVTRLMEALNPSEIKADVQTVQVLDAKPVGAQEKVNDILRQLLAVLDEDVQEVEADVPVKSEQKAAVADQLLAFKARLTVIANEVRAIVNAEAPPPVADTDINAPIVNPLSASGESEEPGNEGSAAGDSQKQPASKTAEPTPHTPAAAMPLPNFKTTSAAMRVQHVSPPPQVNAQNVIEQIVENASLRNVQSNTQMEINLKPEFLGKLSIVLTSTEDGVVATIRAATAEVRNALSANIVQLQNTLRDAGINMRDITITNSTLNSDFTRGEQGAGRNGDERESLGRVARMGRMLARAAGAEPAASAGVYDSSQNMPIINSDITSVEFTA